ncbi:MAG: efflux RND transporter periplasmic adaptor subunit [Cyanobacteria bacterium Co-bin13]|nr:efflux RND transporter periplasmic adaptor subunit [Cyanobacteria bacterium Co-bin13]
MNSPATPQDDSSRYDIETAGPPPGRTSTRQQRRWLPALGLLLLLTGLGLGWRWWQGRAAAPGGQAGAPQSQALPVQLGTLETTTVIDYSEFIGSLDAPDSIEIRPEITGRVSQIYVAKGDRVTAGTPLVQLRPDQREADLASVLASVSVARAGQANALSQVEAARADRIAQEAEVNLQRQNFGRTSTLVERGALSEQALDEVRRDRDTAIAQLAAIDRRIQAAEAGLAEARAGVAQAQANADRANAQLQEATIVAPFDGIVGDIPARVGDVVTNSDILTSLTRNQSLNLRLSVPLERAPELRTGQRVELTDNQGNVVQSGVVSFIAPRVEGNAQSILAEATFDNPSGQLRDGQFVRARLIWEQRPGLLVPATAITRLAGEPFVFVAKPPDPTAQPPQQQPPAAGQPPAGQPPALVAEQRPVQLGNIQGNDYQVLEGLAAGEQIVVSGVLNLADGVPIMPVPPASEAGSGAPMTP